MITKANRWSSFRVGQAVDVFTPRAQGGWSWHRGKVTKIRPSAVTVQLDGERFAMVATRRRDLRDVSPTDDEWGRAARFFSDPSSDLI